MSNFQRLMETGAFTDHAFSVVPTLTNVNHVSILTGCYPEKHGIFGNYYYDRLSGTEHFMERAEDIASPLLFELLQREGRKTALVTAKEKLTRLLDRALDIKINAQHCPPWMEKKLGEPPDIYSGDVSLWILKAAQVVMDEEAPDFMYVATTDYMEHMFQPQSEQMLQHLKELDVHLGAAIEKLDLGKTVVAVTADHGMSDKRVALNVSVILSDAGIEAKVVPLIKDEYFPHHQNLGGASHVVLARESDARRAQAVLMSIEGVERIVSRMEMPSYHLPTLYEHDLFIFAKEDFVLGSWEGQERRKEVRGLRSPRLLPRREGTSALCGGWGKAWSQTG